MSFYLMYKLLLFNYNSAGAANNVTNFNSEGQNYIIFLFVTKYVWKSCSEKDNITYVVT